MGSDLTVVNAARVSFDKERNWEADVNLSEKDQKLLSYLARNGHWTPFSHVQVTLRETVPIFVARQRFKHQIGFTYNEVSRRYVDDAPEFYHPDVWRGKPVNAKQGSSDVEISEFVYEGGTFLISEEYKWVIKRCEEHYNMLIQQGVAPEQARMVLPQSMYTSYYVTGSLSAWSRAYKLRSDEHAQKEIQELASQWNTIIKPLFPHAWSALIEVQ